MKIISSCFYGFVKFLWSWIFPFFAFSFLELFFRKMILFLRGGKPIEKDVPSTFLGEPKYFMGESNYFLEESWSCFCIQKNVVKVTFAPSWNVTQFLSLPRKWQKFWLLFFNTILWYWRYLYLIIICTAKRKAPKSRNEAKAKEMNRTFWAILKRSLQKESRNKQSNGGLFCPATIQAKNCGQIYRSLAPKSLHHGKLRLYPLKKFC